MASRIIHQIFSECELFITSDNQNHVRIRITEKDPEISDNTDFEIEGDRGWIYAVLSNVADVIDNLDLLSKEPN